MQWLRDFLCRIGWHDWRYDHDGDYRVCHNCRLDEATEAVP